MAGILAYSGRFTGMNIGTRDIILIDNDLSESSISISGTTDDILGRAGSVIAQLTHSTKFGLTMASPLWDINYLKLQCGGAITAGSDLLSDETVLITEANKITVTEDPKEFEGEIIGWYKRPMEDNKNYKLINFTEGTRDANVVGVAVGETVCVKYLKRNASAKEFKVKTNAIPDIIHATLVFDIFQAGTTAEQKSGSSKIGELQIEIPRFRLDGNTELALTNTGSASMSLSGTALAYSDSVSCDADNLYSIIKEVYFGEDEFSNVVGIGVKGGDIDLAPTEKEKLQIFKFYSDGTVPSLIEDNTTLTFVSGTTATATIANDGTITAVADGTSDIDITVTSKPELSTIAKVTVTA